MPDPTDQPDKPNETGCPTNLSEELQAIKQRTCFRGRGRFRSGGGYIMGDVATSDVDASLSDIPRLVEIIAELERENARLTERLLASQATVTRLAAELAESRALNSRDGEYHYYRSDE